MKKQLNKLLLALVQTKSFGEQHNAQVNPASASFSTTNSTNIIYCTETGVPIQEIKFDIAVSVTEGSTETDAPEITVGSATVAGNSSTTGTSNSSVNRIQFSIPVLLPLSGQRR
ncbi:hypothetical protein ACLKMH_16335 [Psychromonas sp. KJ10-10]|uniref:hypothetical protein n=1 Tax=Psychromonas sp. KJ10-10 TaxID=3391823 RepID=UPI0039B62557